MTSVPESAGETRGASLSGPGHDRRADELAVEAH